MAIDDEDALAATTYPPPVIGGSESVGRTPATVVGIASGATPICGHAEAISGPAPSVPSGVEATIAASPGADRQLSRSAGARDDHTELVRVESGYYAFDTEIARGGMGRILRARDRRLGREVAIKELLEATPDTRLRFEREARITARLQHPAIVNIYEAGVFANGQAFYAMKLVVGESLDRVIAKTEPGARLGLIPTVLAIADALAYAHSRSVIHRDLKPHNVLVGEFGETVVIDWGLAKNLSTAEPDVVSAPAHRATKDGETIEGSVMGTPAYMPREQAAGERVDERADVYAIGAILYHVLSGTAPYRDKTARDILLQVLSAAPVPLGTLAPQVPHDLLTIVAKAMAREPEDRYPTARELAEDLRRYQTGQLVASHRYSSWQLVRRFVRRNRAVLTVAAILVAVLAVTSTISVQRIIAERNEADVAKQLAERKQAEAVAHRTGAEKLADFMLFKLKERLEPIGKLDLLQGLGDTVVDYYNAVESSGEVGDDQLRQRGDALLVLADVELDKGNLDAANRGLETAKGIRKQLSAKHPDDLDLVFGIGQIEQRLGRVAYSRQDLAKAQTHFTEVQHILQALLARSPKNIKYRRNAAEADRLLGFLARNRNQLDDALAAVERARIALEELADDDQAAKFLVNTYETLATVHVKRGNTAASEGALRKAVEVARRNAARQPADASWASSLVEATNLLGRSRLDSGHPTDALVLLIESRDTSLKLTKLEPDNTVWLEGQAFSWSDVSAAYEALARYDDAMTSAREALAAHERVRSRSPDNVRAIANSNGGRERIARLMILKGDLVGASRELETVQKVTDELAAKHPESLDLQRNVGVTAEQRGDLALARNDVDGAIVLFRKGLAVAAEMSAKEPQNADLIRDLVGSHVKVAQALARKQDAQALKAITDDLIRHARRATALPGNDAEDLLVLALVSAADAAWRVGSHDEARRGAREAVSTAQRDAGAHPQDPMRVMALIEAEGILAKTLSTTAKLEARAVIGRANERLTKLEQEGRAPSIAPAMRKELRGVEQLIGK